MGLQFWHILVFAIIVLLLFGGSRFSAMMGDVAKGLKEFKRGMSDEEEDKRKRHEEQRRAEGQRQLPRDQDPIDVTPRRDEPAAMPPRDDEAR
jgi:sec-independent protein translocase protein TatA